MCRYVGLVLGLLLLVAGEGRAQDGGAPTPSARGGAASLRTVAHLQRLQRLTARVNSGDITSNQTATLAKLAKEVVKDVVKRAEQAQPAPGIAHQMLLSLERAAAAAAPMPVHRGQLLVERARLLNIMGRPEAARELAAEAVQVFRAKLAGWREHPEAGTPTNGTSSEPRQHAAAALASMLDVAALWRQLGREDAANELLADAVLAAPLIPSTPNYLRAMAQLSVFTDEQLEGVLSCVAAVEKQPGPTAEACSWIKLNKAAGENQTQAVADLHRLYYAAHRGLHPRKRYAESWRMLSRAKEIHFSKHNYTLRPFDQMVDDVMKLFPSSSKMATAVVVGEEAAKEGEGAQQQETPTAAKKGWAGWVAGQPQQLLVRGRAALQGLVSRGKQPGGRKAEQAGVSGSSGEPIPIFVLGMPRSGSTLVEQILASHSDVYGAGEHSSLRSVTSKLERLIAGNGTVSTGQLTTFRREYLSSMRSRIPVEHRGAKWMVDKALSNAWLVGHIAMMMPEACIVHAVRHPADASLSAFQQSFFPEKVSWSFNLTNIASHLKEHHRLMAHWDRIVPGRVLHLHYAHMVQDQEGTTRKLVEHCQLPWDDVFLRFYETERAVQTASQLQVKKPIYTHSLNKWPVYKEGLAPLLVELRDTILTYEQQAGLPSSSALLDEVQAALEAQQQRQQAAQQQHMLGGEPGVQQHPDAGPQQPAVSIEQDSTAGGAAESGVAAGEDAVVAASATAAQERNEL